MDSLANLSCDHYRSYVRNNPRFLDYFREATPEQELANLPLGSRPARRRAGGGIETLRAIPWIFAWSQNRLLLPAWLGAGAALTQLWQQDSERQTMQEMAKHWPFFATRLSMLEMVFAKADLQIAEYYDSILVSEELLPLGAALRSQLLSDAQVLLDILDQSRLLENDPWGHESIRLRNIYTAPLNLLQAELLKRERLAGDPEVEQGIMVSIAGIAAGMRNTG
jgi:phosphoenolpyruvate carboxylase